MRLGLFLWHTLVGCKFEERPLPRWALSRPRSRYFTCACGTAYLSGGGE